MNAYRWWDEMCCHCSLPGLDQGGASTSQDEALDAGLPLALVHVWSWQLHGATLRGSTPSDFVHWDLGLPHPSASPNQFLRLSMFPPSPENVSVSLFVLKVTEKPPTCPSRCPDNFCSLLTRTGWEPVIVTDWLRDDAGAARQGYVLCSEDLFLVAYF